jgi:hypothetical protein
MTVASTRLTVGEKLLILVDLEPHFKVYLRNMRDHCSYLRGGCV